MAFRSMTYSNGLIFWLMPEDMHVLKHIEVGHSGLHLPRAA